MDSGFGSDRFDEEFLKYVVRSEEFLGTKDEKELTKEEIEDIVNFLHNPTRVGIWRLKAKWNPDESILRFIESEIEEYIHTNDKLSIIFGKREIIVDIKNPEVLSKIKNNINRFTFVIRLFMYIHKTKMSKDEQSLEFLRSDFGQDDIIIFEMLNMEKIEEKYINTYNLFVNDIFCNDIKPIIRINEIFKFNKGNFILADLSDSISIVSISHESIKVINNFLESLNLIKETSIEAYFSPEELIFDQYVTYLKAVHTRIIEYPAFNRLIEKGISEFSQENYPNCIGTIGIMAEDLLIQIYETLFRDESPKGLSMGQMYDQIQIKIQKGLSSENISPTIELGNLFTETNTILEKIQSPGINVQMETLELIRKVLQLIKEQNEFTRDLIKKKLSSETTISVFPRKIQSNLNELIKYRNAISHKSRIPIGKYEATRTFFCVMTLLIWWNNERRLIDWEEPDYEIIKKITQRNKSN